MIKVSVEVSSEAARFRATVCAQNIASALNLVHARYPDSEAKVLFPIDAEAFFAKEEIHTSEMVMMEPAEKVAV